MKKQKTDKSLEYKNFETSARHIFSVPADAVKQNIQQQRKGDKNDEDFGHLPKSSRSKD